MFNQFKINFPDSTAWVVHETTQSRITGRFGEERAVLRCKQVGSSPEEKEAIIKNIR